MALLILAVGFQYVLYFNSSHELPGSHDWRYKWSHLAGECTDFPCSVHPVLFYIKSFIYFQSHSLTPFAK